MIDSRDRNAGLVFAGMLLGVAANQVATRVWGEASEPPNGSVSSSEPSDSIAAAREEAQKTIAEVAERSATTTDSERLEIIEAARAAATLEAKALIFERTEIIAAARAAAKEVAQSEMNAATARPASGEGSDGPGIETKEQRVERVRGEWSKATEEAEWQQTWTAQRNAERQRSTEERQMQRERDQKALMYRRRG